MTWRIKVDMIAEDEPIDVPGPHAEAYPGTNMPDRETNQDPPLTDSDVDDRPQWDDQTRSDGQTRQDRQSRDDDHPGREQRPNRHGHESDSPRHADDSPRPDQPPPAGGHDQTAADRFRKLASQTGQSSEYEQEQSLWSGSYSHRSMVGVWIALGFATVLLVAAAVMFEPISIWIALGLIVLIWGIGILTYLWRRLGIHYELTTQRFIHKDGLLTRHTDRIEVIDISDVSYHQGPVERIFGVGTIVISSSDRSHPELVMVGIDDVSDVATLIDDVRRKERRKRSLHLRQM